MTFPIFLQVSYLDPNNKTLTKQTLESGKVVDGIFPESFGAYKEEIFIADESDSRV